uniref:Gypsy retrotransposon integrase-like protein 1 n=1 Tax=Sinocyclocheilus grahami TaxID=75366 RepID=A0A672M491_SINGR
MSADSVQDAFRRSCDTDRRQCVLNLGQSCESNIQQNKDLLTVPNADVSAILNSHVEWNIGARARAMSVIDHLPQIMSIGTDTLPAYSEQELREKQLADKTLSRVLYYVERQRRPSRRERAKESMAVIRYLKHWDKLVVRNGILYRVSRDQLSRTKRHQFVVPESLVSVILRGIHDDGGHQGQSRSISLARQRLFWLNMDRNVRDYVRLCHRCTVSKTTDPSGRAPLESISTSRPLELVCIDFWSAEDSTNKSVDVLVVTDHFTRLAQAFVCRDQSAKQVARVLWDKYFCIYGLPERIHSDQGPSFESKLIRELLRVSGVNKSHTTPYHPMGNGSVERFNRTLGNMIRALSPDVKRDWPRRLQTLTFLYNCTTHETTGYAPFYLMFGRVPRLPIDILFRSVLNDSAVTCCDKFVITLVKDLKEALQIAQEHATKEQKRHAELYNRRVKGLDIDIGDQVLLANKTERGKRKVADRWESTVYTVVDRIPDIHTYRIRNPATGQEKVVHRNLLMLVNFLPVTMKNSLSGQVSDASDSCQRSPSDLSLSTVEDETLGGDAEVSKTSCSSVAVDGSEMMRDNALSTCDNVGIDCENDSMSVRESDNRIRTISWVSELPESCIQDE